MKRSLRIVPGMQVVWIPMSVTFWVVKHGPPSDLTIAAQLFRPPYTIGNLCRITTFRGGRDGARSMTFHSTVIFPHILGKIKCKMDSSSIKTPCLCIKFRM